MQRGWEGTCYRVLSSGNSLEAEEEEGNTHTSFRSSYGDRDRPVTHGLGALEDDYVVAQGFFL